MQRQPVALLAFLVLILSGLAFVPTVQATTETYTEGFEGFSSFQGPTGQFQPDGPTYTSSTTGTPNWYIDSAEPHSGTKGLRYKDAGIADRASFLMSEDLCDMEAFTFWFKLLTLPPSGYNSFGFILTPGTSLAVGSTDSIVFTVNQVGTVAAEAENSAVFAFPTTLVADTYYDLTIANIDCPTGQLSVESVGLGGGALLDSSTAINSLPNFIVSDSLATTTLGNIIYFDDFSLSQTIIQPAFWCSSPTSTNFGYDFKEDVTRDTAEIDIGIDPFYSFDGSASDYAYLGKSWGGTQATPLSGSTHMQDYLRIEAGVEGVTSHFRSSYTFIRATGTSSAPIMDKGTGSTAGDSSGDFAEHLEAEFVELDNGWEIKFWYTSVAGGITARTQFGPGTVINDNPNTAHAYYHEIDTVGNIMRVSRFDGTTLIENTIPSPFTSDEMYGHYFVGYDTGFGTGQGITALDEDRNTNFSTCYFDLTGAIAFNGNQGTIPNDITDPGGNETATATAGGVLIPGTIVPAGWTASALNGFLAFILIGACGGGLWAAFGRHWIALLIGSIMGFVLALLFQLLSVVWLILVVIIGLVVIFLKIKSSATGGGA